MSQIAAPPTAEPAPVGSSWSVTTYFVWCEKWPAGHGRRYPGRLPGNFKSAESAGRKYDRLRQEHPEAVYELCESTQSGRVLRRSDR